MTDDSACAGSNPAPLRSIIEPELAALTSLRSMRTGQLGRAAAFELAGADSAQSRVERPTRMLKTVSAPLPEIERAQQPPRIGSAPPPHVEPHAHSIFHEPWWLDIATQG